MTPVKPAFQPDFLVTFAIILTFLFAFSSPAAGQDLGPFEAHGDVGDVRQPGTVNYDVDKQEFTIEGSGENMWFAEDQFHYLYRKLSGDFILRARARFVGKGADPHRKLGWIVRSELNAPSAHVNASVHGDGLTSLQFRRAAGDSTEEIRSSAEAPDVIQLERQGDTFILSVAQFGEPFTSDTLSGIDLGEVLYAGLYVCAHNPDVVEKALFRNVRIIKPAGDELVPYQDYLGSNLEVMDVESGHRRILHQSDESLQAPNWTPDGTNLLYNHNGLLYHYDLEQNRPEVLDTDFAINNNNDHVLTFDGTRLGISDHTEHPEGASLIYVLPSGGGEPKRVTQKGPSYLHGWSPDNKFVIYTAQREGEYDIYKIAVDGEGEEIRLTSSPGLDDGPEYTPDGRYIYYNSVRSGRMEVWRMAPDGTRHEQLTDDRYQNWFPHISPDGQRVVFLSYPESVPPGDHPFYKRVYLRMMPAGGGDPVVIGYLYGGQGTINVPSWSPDGKRISFVSNTGEFVSND